METGHRTTILGDEERSDCARRVRTARRGFSPILDAKSERLGRMKLMKQALACVSQQGASSFVAHSFYREIEDVIPADEMPPTDVVVAAVMAVRAGAIGRLLWPKLHALATAMRCGTTTDKNFQQDYSRLKL